MTNKGVNLTMNGAIIFKTTESQGVVPLDLNLKNTSKMKKYPRKAHRDPHQHSEITRFYVEYLVQSIAVNEPFSTNKVQNTKQSP